MIYFKVFRGYGDDFVSIPEKDLERAIYAQLKGDVVLVTSGGTIAGHKIEMIKPDYHKSMGWNYGYRLEAADWDDIGKKIGNLESRILEAGNRVKHFMIVGREELVGTGAYIAQVSGIMSELALVKNI